MKRYKSADEFIAGQEEWRASLETLREIILETELKEEIKWGAPCYTWNGKNIVGMSSFKSYFGIWFFQGALLEDSAKKLVNAQEGVTQAMRQWRMQSPSDIDRALVIAYIEEAIENQRAGREIKPVKKKAIEIPVELKNALEGSSELSSSFENLTPYKQREYVEYITTAKREETRLNRLQKIIPMIKSGKGMNDKYR